jgi:EAL domain-containing protein (putative c-di-GMP-specific phosphodiesterase class I)
MQHNWQNIIKNLDYAFQPIVHIHTGKTYAVEALIRNVIGNNGLTSINDLFNQAFNDNYLYELDLTLREIALRKFSYIGYDNLKLFYNLDNRIIYDDTFKNDEKSPTLKTLMNKFNINKNDICFELSEKGTSIEQNAMSTMIQKYKSKGYSIAIDDFGIGVSGLKLLYFSEANIIKLDRFFISNIDQDQKKKLFCSSIIEMAHIMGMTVVAEGIETKKEFYTCREIGADFVQGYLIQKPQVDITKIKKNYKIVTNLIDNDKRTNSTLRFDNKYIKKIPALSINTSLYQLFIHFKEETQNNFVPIVDKNGNFLGVVF